jgi:hypothetical protein
MLVHVGMEQAHGKLGPSMAVKRVGGGSVAEQADAPGGKFGCDDRLIAKEWGMSWKDTQN